MQHDLNRRAPLDDRSTGINAAMIMALVAAVLIVGALFVWGPWNRGSHNSIASDMSRSPTAGSASTSRPAAPVTAPAPATTQ
jgi:hypothetical protein